MKLNYFREEIDYNPNKNLIDFSHPYYQVHVHVKIGESGKLAFSLAEFFG